MYKQILLSIDLNEEASWKKALPTAIEYCQAFGSTLHLITVVPDYVLPSVAQGFPKGFEKQAIAQVTQELEAMADRTVPKGISVRHTVAYGTIYSEILRTASKTGVDLIIMASHRPALKDYLLGPNAARVVRHANCSVLVVRD